MFVDWGCAPNLYTNHGTSGADIAEPAVESGPPADIPGCCDFDEVNGSLFTHIFVSIESDLLHAERGARLPGSMSPPPEHILPVDCPANANPKGDRYATC
jgi:hypothetical protein